MDGVKYNAPETQFFKHLRSIDNSLNRIAYSLEMIMAQNEPIEEEQEQTEKVETEE